MPAEKSVHVQLEFSAAETAILVELRARLGLLSDADLIRVALFNLASREDLGRVPPSAFALSGSRRSTRST